MTDSIPPTEKRCPGCKETKPIFSFRKNGNHYDGVNTYCRSCEHRKKAKREIFPDGYKRCTYCREIKPFDQFFHDKGTIDKHGYECKPCHKERHNRLIAPFETDEIYQRGPRRKRPVEVLPEGQKRCMICEKVKAASAFTKRTKSSDGLYPYCRDCERLRVRRVRPIPETKCCAKCGEEKASIEFYLTINRGRPVLHSWCNMCCRANTAKNREQKEPQPYHRIKKRWQELRKYGITIEDYDSMLQEQGGACAICKRPETTLINGEPFALAVDHCHTTGAVRGLLCANCNRALGLIGEDPERAEGLLRYIQERVLY